MLNTLTDCSYSILARAITPHSVSTMSDFGYSQCIIDTSESGVYITNRMLHRSLSLHLYSRTISIRIFGIDFHIITQITDSIQRASTEHGPAFRKGQLVDFLSSSFFRSWLFHLTLDYRAKLVVKTI